MFDGGSWIMVAILAALVLYSVIQSNKAVDKDRRSNHSIDDILKRDQEKFEQWYNNRE